MVVCLTNQLGTMSITGGEDQLLPRLVARVIQLVCLTCMPYMYALYPLHVALCPLHVCLICMPYTPYMHALYVSDRQARDHPVIDIVHNKSLSLSLSLSLSPSLPLSQATRSPLGSALITGRTMSTTSERPSVCTRAEVRE